MHLKNYTAAILLIIKDKIRPLLHPAIHRRNKELTEKRAEFFKSFIRPGDLVFDIGANLGNRVEALLQAGAKVVAYEPQFTCYSYLALKFKKRVRVMNVALGEASGKSTITLNKDSSTIATMSDQWLKNVGGRRFSAYRWGNKQEVTVDTLDSQMHKLGEPTFIKIDVEGFEEQVLKGLKTPVPMLSFEYTTPEMTQSALNCIDLLYRLSVDYEFNYAISENTWFEQKRWLSFDEIKALMQTDITTFQGFGDIYARLRK